MKYLALLILISCAAKEEKTVVSIESCASSGRCRVFFDDKTSDLLLYPYIGQKVKIKR